MTLKTGDYGSRIRMSAFHDEMYAKAMRDLMKDAGMKSVALERVE